MATYAIRPKDNQAEFIALCSVPEVVVQEICEVCYRQGIIWHAHSESEPHKGSPHFKPYKCTPESLRSLADKLEKEKK